MNQSKALVCVLAAFLTGCYTGPPRKPGHAPDWTGKDTVPAPQPPAHVPGPSPIPHSPPIPAFTNRIAGAWIPLNRWCHANNLAAPSRLPAGPLPTYALHTTNGAFVLRAGSQSAQWNGVEVRLGFAPQIIDHEPFVHSLDLEKTILPLLGGPSLCWLKTNQIIVIDPGHGSLNSGAMSVLGGHCEKEYTLDWARRLQVLLATNGWQVFLTRTNDTDLALSNRVTFAENHQAALFISLHFNSSAPNDHEQGLETYCLTPAGMPSTVTRGFSDEKALVFPNNAFDAENIQLAYLVHRALLQANGSQDRGVRRVRFTAVLRGQQRPAILIEGGYLSNPHEARLIDDPTHRQKLAEAVARALALPGKPEAWTPKPEVVPATNSPAPSLEQTNSPP